MKKKQFFLISFLSILLSTNVNAALDITKTLKEPINMLGGLLGLIITTISTNPGVWVKFLIWLGVLGLLFQLASSIPFLNNKTSKILAFVIATISVVFVPDGILKMIASLYGGLIITLIFIVPEIVLGLVSIHFWRQYEHTHPKVIAGIIVILWLIFIGLFAAIQTQMSVSVDWASVGSTIEKVVPWMSLIALFFIVYFLRHVFMSGASGIGAGIAGAAGAAAGGAGRSFGLLGGLFGGIKNWFGNKPIRGGSVENTEENILAGDTEMEKRIEELKNLETELQNSITGEGATVEQANRAIEAAGKALEQADQTQDFTKKRQLYDYANRVIQIAANIITKQGEVADKISEQVDKEAEGATKTRAEAEAQRRQERTSSRTEKSTGRKKTAKKSKEAKGLAYTEKSESSAIKRKTKAENKEIKKIKKGSEEELLTLKEIGELINNIIYLNKIGSPAGIPGQQTKLRELLQRLYGEKQKVTAAIDKLNEIDKDILNIEVKLENVAKIKKGIDILKVQEAKKK